MILLITKPDKLASEFLAALEKEFPTASFEMREADPRYGWKESDTSVYVIDKVTPIELWAPIDDFTLRYWEILGK